MPEKARTNTPEKNSLNLSMAPPDRQLPPGKPEEKYYCADLSGSPHWGKTPTEAQQKATAVNQSMRH